MAENKQSILLDLRKAVLGVKADDEGGEPRKPRIVIYPARLSVTEAVQIAILNKEFHPSDEYIKDTTGTITDNLLMFDKPSSDRSVLPPTEEKKPLRWGVWL